MFNILDLEVGDHFIEDCYSEVYEVIELITNGVIAINTDTDEEVSFICNHSAYCPVIYLVD